MSQSDASSRGARPAAPARAGRASPVTIALIALTFLLVVAVWLYAHRDLGAIARTKASGQKIVTAIEAYQRDTGHYPDSLAALVPRYLPRIVPPDWGLRAWSYKHYSERARAGSEAATAAAGPGGSKEYFALSVAANPSYYPVLFYDITDQRWILNN